jgi:tetratricopeptide (TPR) repeat protein
MDASQSEGRRRLGNQDSSIAECTGKAGLEGGLKSVAGHVSRGDVAAAGGDGPVSSPKRDLGTVRSPSQNEGKIVFATKALKNEGGDVHKADVHKAMEKASDLNNLGALYRAQGEYAEAEPFYKRALAILENTLGSEHPDVVESMENYTGLLRTIEENAEAPNIEDGAKTASAKHTEKSLAY